MCSQLMVTKLSKLGSTNARVVETFGCPVWTMTERQTHNKLLTQNLKTKQCTFNNDPTFVFIEVESNVTSTKAWGESSEFLLFDEM